MSLLSSAGLVRAQECELGPRVPFAGHSLPLDSSPDPQPMTMVSAYPNLFFGEAVFATAPPDGTDRIVVVDQRGAIRIFPNQSNVQQTDTFLDLAGVVDGSGNEMGLLGLAFDPDYSTNGRFYVHYTGGSSCTGPTPNGICSRIVRYEVSSNDPNRADPNSAQLILEVPQDYEVHNGGMLAFGPDGFLYASLGDGGSNSGRSLDLSNALGSLLRLDVSDGAPSVIPASNPFVNQPGAAGEIFHYGLRNPWRFSFDRATGDLWIGDVGGSQYEEINFLTAGTPGGTNFGWDECEGDGHNGPPAGAQCSSISSTAPIYEYAHTGGYVSVTGGYVYRGDQFPSLYGAYLFTDIGSRQIFAFDRLSGQPPEQIATAIDGVVSFGEDENGEILLVEQGRIYRLALQGGGGGGGQAFPQALSATGLFDGLSPLDPADGVLEYTVSSPLWSDGAEKQRFMALPAGQRVAFHATEGWDFPVGTAFIKNFALPRFDGSPKKIETRILVRQTTRWQGVTYRWNEAETDATLQTSGSVDIIDLGGGQSQTYEIPSSASCLTCHNAEAGRVLGTRTQQFMGPFAEMGISRSQLEAWSCMGLFDVIGLDATRLAHVGHLSKIDNLGEGRVHRVRSYLDVNCASCHQPGGPAPTSLDFRFDTPLHEMNAIDIPPTEGDLGIPQPNRITPGQKETSVAWLRLQSQNAAERMAPGTRLADFVATNEVGVWIDQELMASRDSDGDGIDDALDVCPIVADPGQADHDSDGEGDACDPDDAPDLSIEFVHVPTVGNVGGTVSLTAVARNTGMREASNFPVTFYLSADSQLDRFSDPPIGSCWIDSVTQGAVDGCTLPQAQIPMDLAPAELRWIVCVDSQGIVGDLNSTNDCQIAAAPIQVPEPVLPLSVWIGAAWLIGAVGLRKRGA